MPLARMLADMRLTALDSGDAYMLETIQVFQDRLIETFRRNNSRFNVARFTAACKGDK